MLTISLVLHAFLGEGGGGGDNGKKSLRNLGRNWGEIGLFKSRSQPTALLSPQPEKRKEREELKNQPKIF